MKKKDDNIQEKQIVYQQAKNYAQAIACETTFDDDADHKTTLDDVRLTQTGFDYTSDAQINTQYVVYWGGDWGCEGGTGTYSYFLTELSRCCNSHPFLVCTQDILADVNSEEMHINGRFIEQVEFANGALVITASDFSQSGDDLNHFPQDRYRYTVAYDEDEQVWRSANKHFL